MQRTTLETVAQRAGVSRMTVSRVMRHAPGVAPATRDAVLRAAAELGYQRDPLLSAWACAFRGRTQETRALAFLGCGEGEGSWQHDPSQRGMFEGAQQRARELGWHLIPLGREQGGAVRLAQILQARGVEGLLIGGLPRAHNHLRLDWGRYAVAALGHSLTRPVFHRVASNHLQSIQLAMRELARRGYRRVGLAATQHEDARFGAHLMSGYLGVQAGLAPAHRVAAYFPKREGGGEAPFRQWLVDERPDAVVLSSAFASFAQWLIFPGGPGVVTLGGAPDRLGMAHVVRDFPTLGRHGVELVVAQLHRNERGIPAQPVTLMLDCAWVDGPSVRPRR